MRNFRCQPNELFNINFMGRGPSGPWHHHGRGHHGRGFGRDEDPRHNLREEFNFKRILGHGDLRFVILSLLDQKPSYGYELIKAIEEKSDGHYAPSPGVIYPTLTFLQEGGFATVTTQDGKNLYTITPEGKAMLGENQKIVDAIFERMSMFGERMSRLKDWFSGEDAFRGRGRRGKGDKPIHEGFHALRQALSSRMPLSEEDEKAVGEILKKAADEISRLGKTKADPKE